MKSATKRALSMMLSGAMLVAGLVIYAVLIRPEYAVIQELRGEVEAKSKILEETKNASAGIENLKLQFKQDEKAIETLSLVLPEDENISYLMAQLNALSQGNGLAIQSINIAYLPVKSSPARLSSAKGMGTLRLDARISGTYSGLKKFLQDSENNIRIMDVRNLRLSQEGKVGQDLLSYGLTIDTYYQTK